MFRVVRPLRRDDTDDDVDASGDRGRRVVCASSRGARIGDLLLRALPFAALLDPSRWTTHCHACFRSAEDGTATAMPLSRCGRCRAVYYCSRACQQRDWKPDHAVECSKLAQLTTLRLRSDQLADVLLLGRVVRRVATNAAALDANDEDDAATPLRLMWDEADCTKETELLAVLAQKLGIVTGESTATSVRHLQRLLSRFRLNNFAICDARLESVAAGCFPLAAMVNHSCEPNAVVTFEAATHAMEFRALRAIKTDEEITHAYVDMVLPRRARQERLGDRYHFTCACPRCSAPLQNESTRDRFLDADVDGVEEAEWSTTRRQQVEASLALLDQAMAPERPASRDDALATVTKALAMQDAVLHHDNVQRLATLSHVFSLQMDDSHSLQDAVDTGERIQRVYEHVYPEYHPIVGLHLFTLGDLCAAVGLREPTQRYLTKAERILRVTHGENHAFVRMLEQRLAEAS